MFSNIKKFVSVTALSFVASSASAAFIDSGDYLTDTDTGLDWLDVTTSLNMSYDEVSSQISAGGQFEGWRYATGDEFNTLLSSYTGVANNGYLVTYVSDDAKLDDLIQILGDTLYKEDIRHGYDRHSSCGGYGCGTTATNGILEHGSFDGYADLKRTAKVLDYAEERQLVDYYYAYIHSFELNERHPQFGSFLVRNTSDTEVSEPSAIALLGLGLAGLAVIRRRT